MMVAVNVTIISKYIKIWVIHSIVLVIESKAIKKCVSCRRKGKTSSIAMAIDLNKNSFIAAE